jgi:hypothetical protein
MWFIKAVEGHHRFLDNERITQTDHYHPLVRQVLHGVNGQRVQRILDRGLLCVTNTPFSSSASASASGQFPWAGGRCRIAARVA